MKLIKNYRQLLLITAFLFSLIQSKAQMGDTLSVIKKNKLIFSISSGIAIPLGEFSYFKKDIYTETENLAGSPKVGFNGKCDIAYLFSNTFGINLMFYSSVYKTLTPDSRELFPPPCGAPAMGGGSSLRSYNYISKMWNTNGIVLGPTIGTTKGKIRLNFKLASGIQQTKCPEIRLDKTGFIWQMNWTIDHPYNSSIIQPELISYNFVFNCGYNIQITLRKKFAITINMDYLTSHVIFNGQSKYISDVNDGIKTTHSEFTNPVNFIKDISVFHINAGVSYVIN